MKKYFLIAALILTATTFAQKKKATKPAATSSALAKSGNLSMELVKNNLYLFIANKPKKDTILLKTFTGATMPTDCKITPFTAKGTALNLINWTESSLTETKEKTENKVQIYSEVWNTATKTKPVSNIQGITNIKEIQWLDKGKNASQTVEKKRNEGYEFILTKEGDVKLKNKQGETTMIYNPSSNVYQNAKDLKKK
ncbi:hypothetical protein G4D82_13415 [Flavobacterium sp. CYK-4]|uniref:hypothetical protein n=1 Tax=Flavobacterium lotistagni TaxID=2709660 RepID=UPI0014092E77|nr:hypothetical protein [Flavobacterium lotistagni]NHM08222.1 hypothetical protein [Flavobacterium lotistagni]